MDRKDLLHLINMQRICDIPEAIMRKWKHGQHCDLDRKRAHNIIEMVKEMNIDPQIPVREPFELYLRNAVVRNTQMDNYTLTTDTRFNIAAIDTVNKKIRLNQEIPNLVKYGVETFGSDKGWYLMRDAGSACLIIRIENDGTYDWIYYVDIWSVNSGNTYPVGMTCQFFNPFMNYNFVTEEPIVAVGAAGSWNSLGMQSEGMWKTNSGRYRMVAQGTSTADRLGRLGLIESLDLTNWYYLNNEDYMYAPGEGVFNIPGVCVAGTGLYPIGNPLRIGYNEYLNFFTMGNGTVTGIGWAKFNEDFVISEVSQKLIDFTSIGYPADYVQHSCTAVKHKGRYHLFFIDRASSTQSTWKVVEAIIDDLSTMKVVGGRTVIENPGTSKDRFNSQHMDGVCPFIWNDRIYLLLFGTGLGGTYSIYQSNREVGLMKQQTDGSFVMDTRSPLLLNPINSNYGWNIGGCQDHFGGGTSLWFTDTVMHMFCTMNSSSDTYRIWHIKIRLAVPAPIVIPD